MEDDKDFIVDEFVEEANKAVGLTSPSEEYLDLIAPKYIETDAMRHSMKKLYNCALVARGLMRQIGVNYPPLYVPYAIGTAVTQVVRAFGKKWRTDTENFDAEPGDILLIRGASTASEHVLSVVRRLDGRTFYSVEGTTVPNVHIERRERTFSAGKMVMIGSRKLVGWGNVIDLPLYF